MKYEIEIPELPEGVKPVRYGVLGDAEFYFGNGYISAGPTASVWLIVKPDEGFEFSVGDFGLVNIRRIPRKRVRAEFDMPDGVSIIQDLRIIDDDGDYYEARNLGLSIGLITEEVDA